MCMAVRSRSKGATSINLVRNFPSLNPQPSTHGSCRVHYCIVCLDLNNKDYVCKENAC
jgi:hypothetical protein